MFSENEIASKAMTSTYQEGFNVQPQKEKLDLNKIAEMVKKQRQGRTIEKLQPLQAIMPNVDDYIRVPKHRHRLSEQGFKEPLAPRT